MGLLIKQLAMFMAMSLLQSNWLCHGCLEHERDALMELKTFFNSTKLSEWKSDSNCCEWYRVLCDDITGRVVDISLVNVRDTNMMEDWYLNVSLFLPFKYLESLTLPGNNIASCLENHGFDKLSRLSRLEMVDLDDNKFSNGVLSSLSSLPNLNYLSLHHNRLQGVNKIQGGYKNLRILGMGYNQIEGLECFNGSNNLEELDVRSNLIRPDFSLSNLQCFSSLELLDWSENSVNGTFSLEGLSLLRELHLENVTQNGLQIVGASSSLQEIYMSGNKFNGPIFGKCNLTSVNKLKMDESFLNELALQSLEYLPSLQSLTIANLNDALLAHGFISLKNLESLSLNCSTIMQSNSLRHIEKLPALETLKVYDSVLGGSVLASPGLCNLNQLRELHLIKTDLKGILPNCLANLTYLESLTLDSHLLQIPISLHPLLNNSNLANLEIENCEVYEDIQIKRSLIPKFRLKDLQLSGHGSLSSFPKFLHHQNNLSILSIKDIEIKGEFPHWLLSNNAELQVVQLVNLSLGGSLRLLTRPLNSLGHLNISYNNLQGHVPMEFFTYFPELKILDMSWNYLSGSVLTSLKNATLLDTIDLSYNAFSGQIPSKFGSSNMLQLFLNNNRFQRFSSDSFHDFVNLHLLDLSYNSLVGNIPESIGQLSSLSFLIMGHNYLSGEIPKGLCKLEQLSLIDLSYNNLSGHIPSCLKLITYENFGMRFQLPIKNLVITMKRMSQTYRQNIFILFSGIDLSCNNLTGKIPPEIGSLSNVLSLNFSHNKLIGQIPSTLSKLRRIMSLDLSYNKLQGKIPPELTELTFLSSFSVAHNNLSGKVPDLTGQFGTFEANSYEGNPFLCGLPLRKNCTSKALPPSGGLKHNGETNGFIDLIAFYASFGASYVVFLLGLFAVLFVNPNWRRRWFYFIEMLINNVYYLLADNILFLFGVRVYRPLV